MGHTEMLLAVAGLSPEAVNATTRRLFITAILITYVIEFSELYQADWINQVRSIKLIGLILGYTFLWTDLVAYTVGITIGVLIDRVLRLPQSQN